MKALSYWTIALLAAFSIAGAESRYTIEMTPYVAGDTHFYNPSGEIFSGMLDNPGFVNAVIWDGQTNRPAELYLANEKGDGFKNIRVGYDLTLGSEHPIMRAYVRINGATTVIEPFGGESTWAYHLNAHSHVVGSAEAPVRKRQPFIFKDGVTRNLNELIDGPVRFDTPHLIRDDGIIFGSRYIDGGASAVIRLTPRADGKYDAIELTTLPTYVNFNKNGDVIFKSGLWRNGQIIPLGDLGVPDRVYPYAINSAGQIVGVAMTPDDNNYHGFLWDGQMHDLKDFVQFPAGWSPSPIGEDINEFGQIAGYVWTGSTHMLLRLTPAPKIVAATTSGASISIRLGAGNARAVSVETSTDFKQWTEVISVSKPGPDETVELPAASGSVQFFRVTRAD